MPSTAYLSSVPLDSREPAARTSRPTCFAEFIGQQQVIWNLRCSVEAARQGGWPLDHFLFSGPPGVGKTSLASIIARELGEEITIASAPSIAHKGELAGLLTSLRPRQVLFIDEIHRLPLALQELLYGAMEDFRIELFIDRKSRSEAVSVQLSPFTLLGATTQVGLISAPLLDRFGFHWQLQLYDHRDLTAIVAQSARLLGFSVTHAGAAEIARRSRGTPRIANRLLRRIRDHAQVSRAAGVPTLIDDLMVNAALSRLLVDQAGLDPTDRAYLRCLAAQGRRAVGIEAIVAWLNTPRATLEEVVEPLLVSLGLVLRSPRGRMLSDAGERHLALATEAGF